MAEYRAAVEEIHKARQKAFQDAVEKTKAVLSPEQVKKYEKMLEEHRHRGPRGPWGHSRGRESREENKASENGGAKASPETKGQNGKDE